MRKYKHQEMEFFSHFEPKQNWFQRNEETLALAGIMFAVGSLVIISIVNYLILE
jgi:hypothetical protein